MQTHKQRVFLAARKRKIPLETVRRLLRDLGSPPTLSEKPEVRDFYDSGEGFSGKSPYTKRNPGDFRDISQETADQLIDLFAEASCTNRHKP